jgi:hypothetical protein
MGTTALGWVTEQATNSVPTSGEIADLYLKEGIIAWTFLDESGPLPLNVENIQRILLDDFETAYPVAEAAADLYTEIVFRPLVAAMKRSSPHGPTNASTSANSPSTSKRPLRSIPSSPVASEASTPSDA